MTSGTKTADQRERWLALMQELNSDIDPQAIRLLDRLRLVSHSLYQLGEQSLDAAGLSYARFRLLMSLYMSQELGGGSGLNPSEISDRQGISRNTVSTLIRDLEDEGLIERTLDPDDRRRFIIRLTAEGRQLVREHAAAHFAQVAGCFNVLTSADQEDLDHLLCRLGESIESARREIA